MKICKKGGGKKLWTKKRSKFSSFWFFRPEIAENQQNGQNGNYSFVHNFFFHPLFFKIFLSEVSRFNRASRYFNKNLNCRHANPVKKSKNYRKLEKFRFFTKRNVLTVEFVNSDNKNGLYDYKWTK